MHQFREGQFREAFADQKGIGSSREARVTSHSLDAPIYSMQDHRKLHVWARAHALAIAARRATREFPPSGYASLQSQIVRAAESVLFNIIEGCGGRTPKDFAKFLDTSIKSTMELEGELELAKDYGALGHREWGTLSQEVVEVRRMLCGLRTKVLAGPVVTG